MQCYIPDMFKHFIGAQCYSDRKVQLIVFPFLIAHQPNLINLV